jgi:hypothetical protein
VIDKAVQLFGGLGVTVGVPVEALYREVRALRIYEGASEVQKVVIARQHLADRVGVSADVQRHFSAALRTLRPGRHRLLPALFRAVRRGDRGLDRRGARYQTGARCISKCGWACRPSSLKASFAAMSRLGDLLDISGVGRARRPQLDRPRTRHQLRRRAAFRRPLHTRC